MVQRLVADNSQFGGETNLIGQLQFLLSQGQSFTIRQLVMQSMADWYVKADKLGDQVEQQTRLSRILDVAQDLKVNFS